MAAGHLVPWRRGSEGCILVKGQPHSHMLHSHSSHALLACSASAGQSPATGTLNTCLSPSSPQRCDISHKG